MNHNGQKLTASLDKPFLMQYNTNINGGQMNYYPIGTLVKNRHFYERTLGIVKFVDYAWTQPIMTVLWFSSLEETMDEMWELISIEEIDND